MAAIVANTAYSRSKVIPRPTRIARCERKFLRFFPKGFRDETYLDWERRYKERAHEEWRSVLSRSEYQSKLYRGRFREIAVEAVKIESRTNLLFSFEKMAIRDALRAERGARAFAEGLYALLHGPGNLGTRFNRWCEVVAGLPCKQSRVLTWPIVTVFGFIAQPDTHIFLKPTVTRLAAREYGFDFRYRPRPSWDTYSSLLAFADEIESDLHYLHPRDFIDTQSFIWVLGSDEYK